MMLNPAAGAAGTAALRQSGGMGLKEGFMRERVAQLEADLKAASQREGLLETEAMQVGRGTRCFTSSTPSLIIPSLPALESSHTQHTPPRSTSCVGTSQPTRHEWRSYRRTL